MKNSSPISTPKFLSVQLPEIDDDKMETLVWEGSLMGVYLSGHPIQASGIQYDNFPTYSEIRKQPLGSTVKMLGMVIETKEHLDRNNRTMAFITLEDVKMLRVSAIMFSDLYHRSKELLEMGSVVYVKGRLSSNKDNERDASLVIEDIARWEGKGWRVPPKPKGKRR